MVLSQDVAIPLISTAFTEISSTVSKTVYFVKCWFPDVDVNATAQMARFTHATQTQLPCGSANVRRALRIFSCNR